MDIVYVMIGIDVDDLETDHSRVSVGIGRAPRRSPIIHKFGDVDSGRDDRITFGTEW